jgi:Protein of unknown function (DUF3616)
MAGLHIERITLDYLGIPPDPEGKLLRNLSAVAVAGDYLWTASDEGRTVECLKRDGSGYRLHSQINLDDCFEDLPKKNDPGEGLPEADIESLAIHDGYLWICGSHCHVRRKAKAKLGDRGGVRRVSPKLRDRPSRHLLGRVRLDGDGGRLAKRGENLPFGRRGLSAYLAQDDFLGPFLSLPSKENGLDIEGLAISESGTVLLGLRGPLVDSFAVIVELALPRGLSLKGAEMVTHFLDLGGLGVRDLTADGGEILILAGPVSGVRSPFRIYRWKPVDMERQVQTPRLLYPRPGETHSSKPILTDMARADSDEHPEGICVLDRGSDGLIVLYDNPREGLPDGRIEGSKYFADWIPVT